MNNRHIQRDTQLPSMRRGVGGRRQPLQTRRAPAQHEKNGAPHYKSLHEAKFAILFAVALTVVTSGISVSIPYFTGKAYNAFDMAANTLNRLCS